MKDEKISLVFPTPEKTTRKLNLKINIRIARQFNLFDQNFVGQSLNVTLHYFRICSRTFIAMVKNGPTLRNFAHKR